MCSIILADTQDVTRMGMQYFLLQEEMMPTATPNTAMMLEESLHQHPESIVILDPTGFPSLSTNTLSNLIQNYFKAYWLFFGNTLSIDFVKQMQQIGSQSGFLLKDCNSSEIQMALQSAQRKQPYICQQIATEFLISTTESDNQPHLTKTEVAILKDIAMGLTTKEIADKRYSSFHTVHTHRKNIFKKLGINNTHDATRYALKLGLIDPIEYYI